MKKTIFISFVFLSSFLWAQLENPSVESGFAEFSKNGLQTNVKVSDQAIINYDAFNIEKRASVHFEQPSSQSRVLNRVNGSSSSSIQGSLTATGAVYICNPYGVFIGQHALINTAELAIAAASMSSDDFLNGKNVFTQVSGPVVNRGSIVAEQILLLGTSLNNSGNVISRKGNVHLIRTDRDLIIHEDGSHLFLKTPNVEKTENNQKAILISGDAYGLGLYHSGVIEGRNVYLDADVGTAKVNGKVKAHAESGIPEVQVLGKTVDIQDAYITASSKEKGGDIKIGGGNPRISHDLTVADTLISNTLTEIHADAQDEGNGGEVLLWSNGQLQPQGLITAKGGKHHGHGGIIEASSIVGVDFRFEPTFNTLAPHGDGGMIVIDSVIKKNI